MNALEVEGLGKTYRLGTTHDRNYRTLRDAMAALWSRKASVPRAEVQALSDVSFSVREGEAVGIVGRNGAGKSTLLKILSRITAPTTGRARLHGRVASLLEVGTGFHPELTGRENVFLNGAILGMRQAEIRQRFDEIVAFAEVERFLDTPVKRYSSGMFVRLAFAVAAHLTPEILIVDEVLAVGDHEFQQRCLGRMREVATGGRTVLLVSHNLQTVEALCGRCLLLREGRLARFGPTSEVLADYLSSPAPAGASWDCSAWSDREGTGRARITRFEILDAETSTPRATVAFGEAFRLRLHYEAREEILAPTFGMAVLTDRDERIFLSHTPDVGREIARIARQGTIDCTVLAPNILPGVYRLELWITDVFNVSFADHLRMVGQLQVVVGEQRRERVSSLTSPLRGRVFLECAWNEPQRAGEEGLEH